jgi:hypothetical protein
MFGRNFYSRALRKALDSPAISTTPDKSLQRLQLKALLKAGDSREVIRRFEESQVIFNLNKGRYK